MRKLKLITVIIVCWAARLETHAQTSFKLIDEVAGIEVGSQVTDFMATDQNGEWFSLYEALQSGPVVLLFYRGQWCPVCNRYLSGIQDSLAFIQENGARVVAVSPEKQENLQKTADKTKATFTLLYDKDYVISDLFDVTFLPEQKVTSLYNQRLDAELNTAHSDDSQRLPVPATYIIGQDKVVKWRHFDPDYRQRASPKMIIDQLNLME